MTVYTLDNLPNWGKLNVFITATRINFDESEDGCAEMGWVDFSYSSATLWENRNYVRPLISADISGGAIRESDWDSADEIRAEIILAIRSVLGYVDSSDYGTMYGADAVTLDDSSADAFQYAAHVYVKHFTENGWIESPVHIPADVLNGK